MDTETLKEENKIVIKKVYIKSIYIIGTHE